MYCRSAFTRRNSPSTVESDGARDRARRIKSGGAALKEPLAVMVLDGPSGWPSTPWVSGRLKSRLVVRLNLRPAPDRPRDVRASSGRGEIKSSPSIVAFESLRLRLTW